MRSPCGRGLFPLQADVVALDHFVQCRRLQTEQLSRSLLNSARRFQARFYESLLETGDDVAERNALFGHDDVRKPKRRTGANVLGNQSSIDNGTIGKNDGTFDDVLELPDVPRPIVVEQGLNRFGGKLETWAVVLVAVFLEKVLDQKRDVLFALAQRRNVHVDDVQPVVEILPEQTVVDELFKIAVGGGDDTNVDANGVDAPKTHEFFS